MLEFHVRKQRSACLYLKRAKRSGLLQLGDALNDQLAERSSVRIQPLDKLRIMLYVIKTIYASRDIIYLFLQFLEIQVIALYILLGNRRDGITFQKLV